MGRRLAPSGFWTDALHVFILFGFAVTQPLLDMLSRIDAFYLFLHATPASVLAVLVFFSLVLPALAVGIELAAGLWSDRLRRTLHVLLVAALVGLVALPPLRRAGDLPAWAVLAVAALVGAAAALAYIRLAPARTFVTFLAPSILVFPALFLGSSYVSKLVFLKGDAPDVVARVPATAPVVLVIFDELPVTSLMDGRRQIDESLFPGFARLARQATWYRDATAVADYTLDAVPAILSGRYPPPKGVPTVADYPRNLFTLLGGSYDLRVRETYSYLCPESLCPDARERLKGRRAVARLRPLLRLYLAIVFPGEVRRPLLDLAGRVRRPSPRPSQPAPAGAAPPGPSTPDAGKLGEDERARAFDELVASIVPTERPTLYFVHVNLPHFPWEFLPSGKRYPHEPEGAGWRSGMLWPEDDELVLRAYQRHLLQLVFVDRLLGRLLDRLEAAHLYDRALIVVTADHGVSFRPGDRMRDLTATNYPDVLPVPLLVKAPHQRRAAVSDRGVETIDILPTVADLLGIRLPWRVDGRSAVDPAAPAREARRILGSVPYDPARKYVSLERKLRLFGGGKGLEALWRIGPYAELIGRGTEEIGLGGRSNVRIVIRDEDRFAHVDPRAPVLPARITGRVSFGSGPADRLNLAVALNGTVQAVTDIVPPPAGDGDFSVLLPGRAFRAGANVLQTYVVEDGGGRLRLARTAAPNPSP